MQLPSRVAAVLSKCLGRSSASLAGDHPGCVHCRDIPLATCANTVQGRSHIADDRGYICPREQLDSVSGCCLKGELHSCQT